jgi:hypothetical protein
MAITVLSASDNKPCDIASDELATVDEWEGFAVPKWVRSVSILNTHDTALLRVAMHTADGTAAPGAVQNAPLQPGGSVTLLIGGGKGVQERQSSRTIALHSTTAGATFTMLLEEAS